MITILLYVLMLVIGTLFALQGVEEIRRSRIVRRECSMLDEEADLL